MGDSHVITDALASAMAKCEALVASMDAYELWMAPSVLLASMAKDGRMSLADIWGCTTSALGGLVLGSKELGMEDSR